MLLSWAVVLVPINAWAGPLAPVPVLTDKEAWANLPPAEEGSGQPLPAWIRALAGPLPQTAAAMIELDYAQRVEGTLSPRLRAMLRWVAADANRCEYAKAYARADFVRAGGRVEDIDQLSRRIEPLSEPLRLALELVRRLTEAAYTVTDAQIARLVELHGERQVVAMVLVAAYANFQDRLLLALGVSVEPDGPLPPVKVRFRKPPPPAKSSSPEKTSDNKPQDTPKRKLSPPAKAPPGLPTVIDDPEWTAIPFAALQERLATQMKRPRARIPIPNWEAVRKNLPPDSPRRDKPTRIQWTLLNLGYQPRLTLAWFNGLGAFRKESDLDMVYQESMFWVVTRSLQCFY
jgi:alkylhydroperoxidase family enzyme